MKGGTVCGDRWRGGGMGCLVGDGTVYIFQRHRVPPPWGQDVYPVRVPIELVKFMHSVC